MSWTKPPEETITFPNDEPIVLDYKSAVSYMNKSGYDRAQMTLGFVWHQINVHHRGKFSQRSILEALFKAIGDEEFIPMVYKEGSQIDRFLVRQCTPALDRLFLKNLCLTMPNGSTLKLEVILNVAVYKFGQISPSRRIEKALDGLFKKLEKGGILNLNEFAKNPEFGDIVINLQNKAVFETVCRSVFRNEDQFSRVNGLCLKNNNISSLQPLKVFNGCEFDLLDLSGNRLSSSSRICKELAEIKMEQLFLDGNPVTDGEDYPLNMKNLFKNFVKLDGRTIEELRTMPKPKEKDEDDDTVGKSIDPSKPNRLKKYENNDNWNSITCQDMDSNDEKQSLNLTMSIDNTTDDESVCSEIGTKSHESTSLLPVESEPSIVAPAKRQSLRQRQIQRQILKKQTSTAPSKIQVLKKTKRKIINKEIPPRKWKCSREVSCLIKAVKKRPELWDGSESNQKLKRIVWKKVAKEVGQTVRYFDAKKKWTALRYTFRKILTNLCNRNSNQDAVEAANIKFKHLGALMFLKATEIKRMIPNPNEYGKRELLDAFFDALPQELGEIYPCNYIEETTEHTFYVRECYEQLKFLVNHCKLQIQGPDPNAEKLTLQLRMNVKNFDSDPLDAVKAIAKAITLRFIEKDRLLDLEDFNSAIGLEKVELNLRSPRVLNRVLTQASNRFSKKVFELRLGRNRIWSCNFAKPFLQMLHLRVLDLSYNNLKDFSDFFELEKLPIKALNLNGNPLCDAYTYPPEYIKAAKAMFPEITKLDNIELCSLTRLTKKKNFLCDLSGYDLVQQFVNHYFPLFESENRIILKEMYHPKAIFSMTCNYSLAKLNNQSTKRIGRYTNLGRNILKMSDFSRALASLHSGYEEICSALVAIPNVEHDIVGFTTDTTILNDNMVVITVTGVLKDLAQSAVEPDLILAFSRTFILTPFVKETGLLQCATEYLIINDLFSVSNPSDWQMQNSFKFTRNPLKNKDTKLTATDKEGLLVMFQEVTTLKTVWCRRFLDEGNWEFAKALEIFLEQVKKGELPVTFG